MMECGIIRDLLPSYADGLTCEESNIEIEEHLQRCDECRKYLDDIRKEIETTSIEPKKEVNPFLKWKKFYRRELVLVAAIAFSIGVASWEGYQNYYGYGTSLSSEELTFKLEEKDGYTILNFVPKDQDKVIDVWYSANSEMVDGKMPMATLNLVQYNRDPNRRHWAEEQYELYFLDENSVLEMISRSGERTFDEDDFIAIYLHDGVKTIKMSDLRDGNIESLK